MCIRVSRFGYLTHFQGGSMVEIVYFINFKPYIKISSSKIKINKNGKDLKNICHVRVIKLNIYLKFWILKCVFD